jgi:hypothetical protein
MCHYRYPWKSVNLLPILKQVDTLNAAMLGNKNIPSTTTKLIVSKVGKLSSLTPFWIILAGILISVSVFFNLFQFLGKAPRRSLITLAVALIFETVGIGAVTGYAMAAKRRVESLDRMYARDAKLSSTFFLPAWSAVIAIGLAFLAKALQRPSKSMVRQMNQRDQTTLEAGQAAQAEHAAEAVQVAEAEEVRVAIERSKAEYDAAMLRTPVPHVPFDVEEGRTAHVQDRRRRNGGWGSGFLQRVLWR